MPKVTSLLKLYFRRLSADKLSSGENMKLGPWFNGKPNMTLERLANEGTLAIIYPFASYAELQEVMPAVPWGDTVVSQSGTALLSILASHKMFRSDHGGGHKHRSKHHRHHHYGASKSVNVGWTR